MSSNRRFFSKKDKDRVISMPERREPNYLFLEIKRHHSIFVRYHEHLVRRHQIANKQLEQAIKRLGRL